MLKNLNPLFEYAISGDDANIINTWGPTLDPNFGLQLPTKLQKTPMYGPVANQPAPQPVPQPKIPTPAQVGTSIAKQAPKATTTNTDTTAQNAAAPQQSSGGFVDGVMNNLGSIYAGSALTGLGTKIGKDMLLVNKIVNKYPDPKQLAKVLNNMQSDNAKMIAMKLYTAQDRDTYKQIVRKYIAKGTLGRYLWHTITGPISTIYNSISGIDNALDNTTDKIGELVR